MTSLTVGVLRGGPSPEYDVSLKTGGAVLAALPETKYEARDIWIDREGTWHMRGRAMQPDRVIDQLDVVFNALHGPYGEDGTVQRILERFSIPFTGSDAFASALSMNKYHAKRELANAGLTVPRDVLVRADADKDSAIAEILESFPPPFVVKPVNGGSSVGIEIAHGRFALRAALNRVLESAPAALVEEYISGKEATCGVIDNFRGKEHYTLLPVEIMPETEHTFFDYDAKYGGKTRELCPGNFTRWESSVLQRRAQLAHQTLGLRHYSRSDFIIADDDIYLLEANSLPGITSESLLPRSVEAVGDTLSGFLEHVITCAYNNRT